MTRSRFAVSFGGKLDLGLWVGEEAPAASQALVVPQDVHLIMGDLEPIEDTAETAAEVLATARDYRPRRLGSLVLTSRRGAPLLFQAVVYDFERSPPSGEEPVFEALLASFEEARTRRLTSLALRPLGVAHAGVEADAFLRILSQICYSSVELGTSLKRIELLLPSPAELGRYEGLLTQLVAEHPAESS